MNSFTLQTFIHLLRVKKKKNILPIKLTCQGIATPSYWRSNASNSGLFLRCRTQNRWHYQIWHLRVLEQWSRQTIAKFEDWNLFVLGFSTNMLPHFGYPSFDNFTRFVFFLSFFSSLVCWLLGILISPKRKFGFFVSDGVKKRE